MKNFFNISNLYISFWGLYYLQGTIYPFGSIISQGLLLVVLTISLYYWGYANIKYKLPRPIKILNVFILLLILCAIIYQLAGDYAIKSNTGQVLSGFDNIKAITSALLPIYALFTFVKKGFLTEKVLINWFFVILVVISGQFMVYEDIRLLRSNYDVDGLTNNVAYHFLAITPFIFFLRTKKWAMYISILYIYLFIIYGMKRGAILIGLIAIIYIIYTQIKESNFKNRLITLFLSLIIFFILYYFIMDFSSNSSYFQYRLSNTLEGDSSGRDFYYKAFIDSFTNEQSLLKVFLGGGTYTTVKLVGNLAHNDWLELLISHGIIGAFIYLYFWISFYNYKKNFKGIFGFNVLTLFFIIFFLKTFFSMSYTSMGVFALMPVAYFMGTDQKS